MEDFKGHATTDRLHVLLAVGQLGTQGEHAGVGAGEDTAVIAV